MTTYIAILRGINVGGNRKILMADLKKLLSQAGFENITTYIQSGNILFESDANATEIAGTVKQLIFDTYGFDVPVILRTAHEFQELFMNNPFLETAEISQLHVTFLDEIPRNELINGLSNKSFEPDEVTLIGKNAFIKCKGLYHESKFSNAFFEKNLNATATTRNWKTVAKLAELCNGRELDFSGKP